LSVVVVVVVVVVVGVVIVVVIVIQTLNPTPQTFSSKPKALNHKHQTPTDGKAP
jgi:hypothetical protein